MRHTRVTCVWGRAEELLIMARAVWRARAAIYREARQRAEDRRPLASRTPGAPPGALCFFALWLRLEPGPHPVAAARSCRCCRCHGGRGRLACYCQSLQAPVWLAGHQVTRSLGHQVTGMACRQASTPEELLPAAAAVRNVLSWHLGECLSYVSVRQLRKA